MSSQMRRIALARPCQVFQLFHSLRDAGPVAVGHPPHHQPLPLPLCVVPLCPPVVEPPVDRLPDEMLEAWQITPDRQGRGGPGIPAQRPAHIRLGGVHLVTRNVPDIARAAFRYGKNPVEVVTKIGDARVVPVVFQDTNVEFGQVPARHQPSFQQRSRKDHWAMRWARGPMVL